MVEWDFNMLMHGFHFISGFLVLFASFYMYKYHISAFNTWPKNLRIYFVYFCFLTATLFSVNSIIVSGIAIFTNNSRSFMYHIFRLTSTFLCQHLRFAYFMIIMERMVATIYLEKYANFSTNFKFYGIFMIFSVFGHAISSLPSFLTFFGVIASNYQSIGYDTMIWISFITHAITLISCKFLYDKNQQMYKKLAYHCTLQQRHQIVENIKVLKLLWPAVLVFSIVVPIGPAATLIYTLITKNMAPFGLFHMTYNFAPVIMAFYCKFHIQHKNDIGPTASVIKVNHLVVSPLGASLPTHVSQENYFHQLRNVWK